VVERFRTQVKQNSILRLTEVKNSIQVAMELKKTMKAVVVAEEGKLVVKDVPVPVPSEGRVLIKVAAAAQNPTDRTRSSISLQHSY
jgi:hypothetical protein